MHPDPIRTISKLFKHPRAKLQLLGRLTSVSHKVAPLPSPDFTKVFRRALRLYLEEFYTPEEAYQHGILDPTFSEKTLRDFVSKRMMVKIQNSLNPDSWTRLTEDKSIFYRYCMALGTPIPVLYACFFKDKAGWSHTAPVLQDREDWVRFIRDDLPEEFVIKPVWGVYGSGIRVLHRTTAEIFTDTTGLQQDAEEVYNTMLSHPGYDSFVIQERLRNHPDLAQLSDTEYLQTVRVVTFINGSNDRSILCALFKPIVGQNFVDNHDHGRTGNLHNFIDLHIGTLRTAITMTADGSGQKTVSRHPVTDVLFEGFQLPLWKETCQLAMDTARNFLPLRLVGWDIAITPNGPFIIEGNAWADPFPFEGARDIMVSLLNQGENTALPEKDRA